MGQCIDVIMLTFSIISLLRWHPKSKGDQSLLEPTGMGTNRTKRNGELNEEMQELKTKLYEYSELIISLKSELRDVKMQNEKVLDVIENKNKHISISRQIINDALAQNAQLQNENQSLRDELHAIKNGSISTPSSFPINVTSRSDPKKESIPFVNASSNSSSERINLFEMIEETESEEDEVYELTEKLRRVEMENAALTRQLNKLKIHSLGKGVMD